jgi:hypothetical protein
MDGLEEWSSLLLSFVMAWRQNSAYGFAAAFNDFMMSFLEDKMVCFRNAKKGFAV